MVNLLYTSNSTLSHFCVSKHLLLVVKHLTRNVKHKILVVKHLTHNVKHKILVVKRLTRNVEDKILVVKRLTRNVEDIILVVKRLTRVVEDKILVVEHLTSNVKHLTHVVEHLTIFKANCVGFAIKNLTKWNGYTIENEKLSITAYLFQLLVNYRIAAILTHS